MLQSGGRRVAPLVVDVDQNTFRIFLSEPGEDDSVDPASRTSHNHDSAREFCQGSSPSASSRAGSSACALPRTRAIVGPCGRGMQGSTAATLPEIAVRITRIDAHMVWGRNGYRSGSSRVLTRPVQTGLSLDSRVAGVAKTLITPDIAAARRSSRVGCHRHNCAPRVYRFDSTLAAMTRSCYK
jgi:hypothetical protein